MTTHAASLGRRRIGPAAGLLTAVLLVLAISVFLAPDASAAAPIPGSPLDAYDKQIPYDGGVHKIARLAAIIA